MRNPGRVRLLPLAASLVLGSVFALDPILLSAHAKAQHAGAKVDLRITHPVAGADLGDRAEALLVGRALASSAASDRIDIVIVLDTSSSASLPAGVDVDGDGVRGSRLPEEIPGFTEPGSTDPGDSILAAEVRAARDVLRGLDPARTRVGVVSFAGDPAPEGPDTPDGVRAAARTWVPLGTDYARIERGLDAILATGASGMTHMAAGIDRATDELVGRGPAGSAEERQKLVLFLTDGEPTLPHVRGDLTNVLEVRRAAQRAARADVVIHSFAIGAGALVRPLATVEMAAVTGGSFTPVRHPATLGRVLVAAGYADVSRIDVRNLTTGVSAGFVRLLPDGAWDALVPLARGRNRLEVRARAADGGAARVTVDVVRSSSSAEPEPSPALEARRRSLAEAQVVAEEQDRIDAVRQELGEQIARERADALERAAGQRKALDLELSGPGSD